MTNIANLLTEHIDIWTAADTEKKSGRGRASGNAGSVYGVKKLRELILELAVRGKLVPQDSNDETASELLKRIQTEKAKLIAEGKLKKDKPLPPIGEDEKPFDLPDGWAFAYITQVVSSDKYSIKRGPFGSAIKKDYFVNEGFKVYEQQHAINDNFYLGHYYIDKSKFEELSAFEVKANDIIISCSGTVGRVAIAPSDMEAGIINQALLKITLNESVLINTYFKILFPAFYMKTEKLSDLSGTAQKNIVSVDELKNEPFPLPPLAEQHRIVAKVDELMALCDQLEQKHSNAQEAHETLVSQLLATLTHPTVRPELVEGRGSTGSPRTEFEENWQRIYAHFDVLFTTEASIDALKQTLLQLAVMGKLVPQDPNDEPASELLKRIQAEKAKLIAEGKLKKEKPLEPICEEEKPFELPKGWEWIKLETIAQVGTGATPLRTKPEYFNPATISWVTSGETSSSYIFKTEQYVSPLALKETNLTVYPKGSLIVAMYGQGKTRGQITELMVEACTNQACAAIRLYIIDDFHRKYVKLFFEKIYDEIRELSAGGAQPNLNLSKVKETLIPLPPLAEQHRIVAIVDALMALCDQLKTRIQQSNQQQKTIADALVVQAVT